LPAELLEREDTLGNAGIKRIAENIDGGDGLISVISVLFTAAGSGCRNTCNTCNTGRSSFIGCLEFFAHKCRQLSKL
jgi:hypothetical protein